MGELIYWVLIAAVVYFFFWRKPSRRRANAGSYYVRFSRWRDKELLNHLSRFWCPDLYVLELIRRDMNGGGPRPDLPKDYANNKIKEHRVLHIKVDPRTDTDVMDFLTRRCFYLTHYLRDLIICDMNREGAAAFAASLDTNA